MSSDCSLSVKCGQRTAHQPTCYGYWLDSCSFPCTILFGTWSTAHVFKQSIKWTNSFFLLLLLLLCTVSVMLLLSSPYMLPSVRVQFQQQETVSAASGMCAQWVSIIHTCTLLAGWQDCMQTNAPNSFFFNAKISFYVPGSESRVCIGSFKLVFLSSADIHSSLLLSK